MTTLFAVAAAEPVVFWKLASYLLILAALAVIVGCAVGLAIAIVKWALRSFQTDEVFLGEDQRKALDAVLKFDPPRKS